MVVDLFWEAVGSCRWYWVYFVWWWVVLGLLWVVVIGVVFILGGGG